ncbi:hypothetical protein FOMG_18908 [Fusarium oxysporum f. sp. melonis 26406]|uniref:Uncharacterized protein n=1 Tax=Fusarium oxysporum f. sp. melonis 26406 TaxID=1089452 RepID=W9YYX2_FUSOX|nr:hypothetical protein FOMG_18908 [Fusarium oxysporum f. sp. melonis 26406]
MLHPSFAEVVLPARLATRGGSSAMLLMEYHVCIAVHEIQLAN